MNILNFFKWTNDEVEQEPWVYEKEYYLSQKLKGHHIFNRLYKLYKQVKNNVISITSIDSDSSSSSSNKESQDEDEAAVII